MSDSHGRSRRLGVVSWLAVATAATVTAVLAVPRLRRSHHGI